MPTLLIDPSNSLSESHSARSRSFYLTRGLVVIVIVCLLAILWRKKFHYEYFPKRWAVVYEGELYRSGQLSGALVERTLGDHQIDVVIDFTGEEPGNLDQQAEIAACHKLHIEHHRFPLKGDGTGDIETYAAAVHSVEEAVRNHKRVLVHCAAGIHRTGGVLAMYKLHVRNESPESISSGLQEFGFWDQAVNDKLIPFLNQNRQEMALKLSQTGSPALDPEEVPLLGAQTESDSTP
ncbi:MAG: dual specificity protein phosphatase family protein [Planctomycetaceae bacterium]